MRESLETIRTKIDDSNFASHLDVEVTAVEEQEVTCSLPVVEDHLNSGGYVHGGIFYALSDITAGCAVMARVGVDGLTATIEGKLNHVSSADGRQTDRLEARAEIVHLGKQTAVVDVQTMDEAGQLLSKGLFTFAVSSPEK